MSDKSDLQLASTILRDPRFYVHSDDYWAEEKYDGDRMTIEFGIDGAIFCTSRKGTDVHLPKYLRYLTWPEVLTNTRFDGETLGDRFVIFDILSLRGHNLRNAEYQARRAVLEAIFAKFTLPNIELAVVAKTTQEKIDLIHHGMEAKKEGVVFKLVKGTSKQGRTDQWIKYKFYKTCEVILSKKDREDKPEGFTILMLDDSVDPSPLIEVGGCKIPERYQRERGIVAGDVIELRYLRATADKKLYEPVFLRKRSDKLPEDCTWSQVET